MNLYGESADKSVKFLNIKAEMLRSYEVYDITVTYNGKNVPLRKGQTQHKGHPLSKTSIHIPVTPTPAMMKGFLKGVDTYLYVQQDHITELDQENDRIVYCYNGFEITFTKGESATWNLHGPSGPRREVAGAISDF